MPVISINPIRQELTRLKTRLRTFIQGHKLFKDEHGELVKQFVDVVQKNRALRKRMKEGLIRAHGSFTATSALIFTRMLGQALLYPRQDVKLGMTLQNVINVDVPVHHFKTKGDDAGEVYPYGFATTSGESDGTVETLSGVPQDVLHLMETEEISQLLAGEIGKTHCQVNTLEYVEIPQTEEVIQYITVKLDENGHASTIRPMKVKDTLLKRVIKEKREANERTTEAFGGRTGTPEKT